MPCAAMSARYSSVGQLDQDARAVAHQLVGAHRAAVVEVLEDLQTLLDDAVRSLALDVGDEADAAGVAFLARVVEPGGGRVFEFLAAGGCAHGALHGAGAEDYCSAAIKPNALNWGQSTNIETPD